MLFEFLVFRKIGGVFLEEYVQGRIEEYLIELFEFVYEDMMLNLSNDIGIFFLSDMIQKVLDVLILDIELMEFGDIIGKGSLRIGFVNFEINEEMDKFDRLFIISDNDLESNVMKIKLQDRIVIIVVECWKIEEVERFCFVEDLVRDLDYEFFIFWFFDLMD